MSVSNTVVKQTYSGDGSNTTFAIPFTNIVDDSSEVKVYLRDETDPLAITETLQTEGAGNDYTLTGAPTADDFHTDVEFNTAPTSDQKVIVKRVLPLTQTLSTASGYPKPSSLEEAYDRVVAMVQQLNEILTRVPKLSVTEQVSEAGMILPVDIPENGVFAFNSAKTALQLVTPADLFVLATGSDDLSGLAGFSTKKEVSLSDGQSATAVTDMTVSTATEKSAVWFCELRQKSSVGEYVTTFFLHAHYKDTGTWAVHRSIAEGDVQAFGFTINGSGQVSLALTAIGGSSYTGTLRFKRMVLEV